MMQREEVHSERERKKMKCSKKRVALRGRGRLSRVGARELADVLGRGEESDAVRRRME